MGSVCHEIIDDIEDLISSQDITIKERYSNKSMINIRVKRKQVAKQSIDYPIPNYSNIPGTQTIYINTWGCTHNSSDSEYMAGQLVAYGYKLTDDKTQADLWLLNSCTVKNPAVDHFRNEIEAGRRSGKHVVLAGCVPQGAPKADFIKGLSVIGVQQIDRVVEVVEETLKGHSVRLFSQKKKSGKKLGGASLQLPKVRKNPLVEIIPINTGCLNQCTYCKTKHARGHLGSYPPEEIVERAKQCFQEGVVELWLTSEDTGTYGRDIDSSLPELLWALVEVLPPYAMMRVGMTNPPYILEHLEEMSKILNHPRVYSFLHIPVQSGSDMVLADMKREYSCSDFEHVVNYLSERVPDLTIATDIIAGFPTETEKDFEETLSLCEKYKFPSLFINQFFPRPGTPASKMTLIPTQEVKKRTKKLTDLFHSYEPYNHLLNKIQNILVTDSAFDHINYIGHNKEYQQVIIPKINNILGKWIQVKIIETKKYCLIGEFIKILNISNNNDFIINNYETENKYNNNYNETNGDVTNGSFKNIFGTYFKYKESDGDGDDNSLENDNIFYQNDKTNDNICCQNDKINSNNNYCQNDKTNNNECCNTKSKKENKNGLIPNYYQTADFTKEINNTNNNISDDKISKNLILNTINKISESITNTFCKNFVSNDTINTSENITNTISKNLVSNGTINTISKNLVTNGTIDTISKNLVTNGISKNITSAISKNLASNGTINTSKNITSTISKNLVSNGTSKNITSTISKNLVSNDTINTSSKNDTSGTVFKNIYNIIDIIRNITFYFIFPILFSFYFLYFLNILLK